MLKRCSSCGILKEVSEFSKNRAHRDGLQSSCKECNSIQCRGYSQTPNGIASNRRRDERYRQNHREKLAVHAKEYRKDHKQRVAAQIRKYRQTPNGKALNRRNNQERRAIKNNCEGTISTEEFDRIIKNQRNKCNMCGKRFCKTRPATMDHVTPLSKGGAHASSNIQALCGSCNSRKQAKIMKCFIVSWQVE